MKISLEMNKKLSEATIFRGILPTEAGLPIILAKENGYFEENGFNVSITTFASSKDRTIQSERIRCCSWRCDDYSIVYRPWSQI